MKRDLTDRARAAMGEAARVAQNRRWGNRGPSASVRVDREVAEELMCVPERDRRRVASQGIRKEVRQYFKGQATDKA